MVVTQDNSKLLGEWLELSRIEGNADSVLRRRKYPRFSAADDFLIKPAQGDIENAPEHFARGYNISQNGLGILSKWLLHADSAVLIRRGQAPEEEPWVQGKVIHCTQSLTGYKIGLSFEP